MSTESPTSPFLQTEATSGPCSSKNKSSQNASVGVWVVSMKKEWLEMRELKV